MKTTYCDKYNYSKKEKSHGSGPHCFPEQGIQRLKSIGNYTFSMKIARATKMINPDCINPKYRVINFLATVIEAPHYMVLERVNIFVAICFYHWGSLLQCTFLCLHSGQNNPVHLCMILFFFLFRFHKS